MWLLKVSSQLLSGNKALKDEIKSVKTCRQVLGEEETDSGKTIFL